MNTAALFGVWESPRKKTKAEIRQEEMKAHAELLKRKQKQEVTERIKRKFPNHYKLALQIIDRLKSEEFSEWYEATTYKTPEEFVEACSNNIMHGLEYAVSSRQEWSGNWLDWAFSQAEEMIGRVSHRNPYRNPETRGAWIGELQNVTGRHRRALLIRFATPKWANRKAIADKYAESIRLSLKTGIPHAVDHIVPIVNKNVCGLHCEANLRVITVSENSMKSNRFNPWTDG